MGIAICWLLFQTREALIRTVKSARNQLAMIGRTSVEIVLQAHFSDPAELKDKC